MALRRCNGPMYVHPAEYVYGLHSYGTNGPMYVYPAECAFDLPALFKLPLEGRHDRRRIIINYYSLSLIIINYY